MKSTKIWRIEESQIREGGGAIRVEWRLVKVVIVVEIEKIDGFNILTALSQTHNLLNRERKEGKEIIGSDSPL
jgi:hypothetical protein